MQVCRLCLYNHHHNPTGDPSTDCVFICNILSNSC